MDARGLDASVGATIHNPTTAGRSCLVFSSSVSFGRWAEWILWLPSPYRTVYVNPLTTSPLKARVPSVVQTSCGPLIGFILHQAFDELRKSPC